MGLTFGELPTSKMGPGSMAWAEEADALRGRPGDWAMLDTARLSPGSRQGLPGLIKRGKLKAFKDGKFEARSIGGQVWARFVGDDR